MKLNKLLSNSITLHTNPNNTNIGSVIFFKGYYIIYNTVGQRIAYLKSTKSEPKMRFSFDENFIYESQKEGIHQFSYDFKLIKVIGYSDLKNDFYDYYFDLKRSLFVNEKRLAYCFGTEVHPYLTLLQENNIQLKEIQLDSVYNETNFVDFLAITHLLSFSIYDEHIATRIFKIVEKELVKSLESKSSTLKDKTMSEFLFEYFDNLRIVKGLKMMYESKLLD